MKLVGYRRQRQCGPVHSIDSLFIHQSHSPPAVSNQSIKKRLAAEDNWRNKIMQREKELIGIDLLRNEFIDGGIEGD